MKRDPAIIHKTMSAIRGKDTGIEKKLRKALTEKGLRYRIYSKKVVGHPDILFPGLRIAIFCDSEFWHGYRFEENVEQLQRLSDFWIKKIRRNIARDAYVNQALKEQGYTVLRFWGQRIEKELDAVVEEILQTIEKRRQIEEWKATIEERTTLVYIERDNQYLLLHRVKEEADMNEGKWLGVGGHLEGKETHIQAMKREVWEETGLTVDAYEYIGALDFLNDQYPPERMYLFKVTKFHGDLIECNEGELAWVDKDKMMSLPMWEGDKAFLPLLEQKPSSPVWMNLIYRGGELDAVEGPFTRKKKQ
ncbi:MAG: DNA mismatch endonuclease Vsr [Bacilli bacterium]|nr:DNA mismatch endonuclease Vsr [Bacilli bacterium]